MTDLVLRGRRVVTGDGERPAALAVTDGRITAVAPYGAHLPTAQEVSYGDDVVLLPGLVDTHVHLQAPGTDWEGFASGTRAAAAGGVTTVVDMPVDSVPPTVDVAALAAKRAAAQGECHVDVAFWAGVTADHLDDLPALADAGVLGAKAFLTDPGVPGVGALPVALLADAGRVLARLGLPLLVHAELPGPAATADPARPCTRYADHLAAHPPERETAAVDAVVDAARATGCRMHVVHVTTARAAARIGAARAAGVPVSGETCPHLLALAAERSRTGPPSTPSARRCGSGPTPGRCGSRSSPATSTSSSPTTPRRRPAPAVTSRPRPPASPGWSTGCPSCGRWPASAASR